MKVLIALACVAIIAGVGLYFYRDQQAQKQAAVRGAYNECSRFLTDLSRGRSPDDSQRLTSSCILNGFLTSEEIIAAAERGRKARN